MKERPILFSGAMVQAILEGQKTQTRRAVTNAKPYVATDDGIDILWATNALQCPYGQHGDRLWVREAWHSDTQDLSYARAQHEDMVSASPIFYRADNHSPAAGFVWRPSIFMPRWASRITLEIVGVRVERVNEISESDAQAEGANQEFRTVVYSPDGVKDYHMPISYRGGFANLWDSINANRGYSWDSNPWVWVVEFRRLEAR